MDAGTSTQGITAGIAVGTANTQPSIYQSCLRKIFTKCFYTLPALIDILEIDPEIATFCAVSYAKHLSTPYVVPAHTVPAHTQINLRFPARGIPIGVTESGIELSIYLTPTALPTVVPTAIPIRHWRKYSVNDVGLITQTEWRVLSGIDELETELSLSDRGGF